MPIRSRTLPLFALVLGPVVDLASPLQAQTFQMSAVNPVTVQAQDATQVHTAWQPAGPIPPWTQLAATIQVPNSSSLAARAYLAMNASHQPHVARGDLQLYLTATAGALAELQPSEFLVDFTNPTASPVMFTFSRTITGTAGTPLPLLEVDLMDDGSVDYTLAGPQPEWQRIVAASANVPTRIRLSGVLASPGSIGLEFRIRVTPAYTTVTNTVSGCFGVNLDMQPRLDGDLGYTVGLGGLTGPTAVVFGLTPQPQLLGTMSQSNAPCMLWPRPDAVMLWPQGFGSATLPIPPAVRPIKVHAQSVVAFTPLLVTSHGYLVDMR